MTAMGQWDVLGYSSDPVPGDTNQIKLLAESFRTTSDRAGIAQKQTSDAQDDNDLRTNWTGEAAKAYAEHFKGVPDDLTKLHDSYKTAGDALMAYFGNLVTAQAMRDSALRDATQADGDLRNARTAKGTADREADASAKDLQTLQNNGTTPPDPATLQAAVDRHNRAVKSQTTHNNAVNDATGRLNTAKTTCKNAVDIRDKAAKTLADALHHASKQGIRNLHWWETAIDWFYDNIVPYLKIAVAVLGIIALFVSGPLGWIVFGLALAVFAATAYEAFGRHRAGVGDVLLAALDVIPGLKSLSLLTKGKFIAALTKSGKFPGILNAFTKADGVAMKTAKFFSPGGKLKAAWDGKAFKAAEGAGFGKRFAVGSANFSTKYGMQFTSNFATKYATTLAAEHLNGNDVELWNPGAALNAAAGAVVSIGGKDLGTLFKHRVKDGKWLPGKRAADDGRVGKQRETNDARETTHNEKAADERARADRAKEEAAPHRENAEDAKQRAADRRDLRDDQRQTASQKEGDAKQHAKEEQQATGKRDAEQTSANRHENEAATHDKAAADDRAQAGRHDDQAAKADQDAKAHAKDSREHSSQAAEHRQTAQEKATEARAHDESARTSHEKAGEHQSKADEHGTQAREHETKAAEHEAKAKQEPDNPEHAKNAAHEKAQAEEQHKAAERENAEANKHREAETKAKEDADRARRESADAKSAARESHKDAADSRQHSEDANSARDHERQQAKDARDSAGKHDEAAAKERTERDNAQTRADEHQKAVEQAQHAHDKASGEAKQAKEDAAANNKAAKEADKDFKAADREASRHEARATEATNQAKRHDNLAQNKDPDGDARYTKPYHRLLDSTADSLNTRRHWYSGGMNSMTSSIVGKAVEDAWKSHNGERVDWAGDLSKSAFTGFTGGAGQQIVSKWHVNAGGLSPFRSGDTHAFGVRDWSKPGWQWERTAEIGVKRVAKDLPDWYTEAEDKVFGP
ncbi:DUF5336 domain-containing protein [Yinghuangia seranimata]|uniref:DUF5336 domain-containing protein n=1 Tax=Yinghuangia seranimata TaxID=408067 RepID=UPI00248AEEC5|nr:hypothetical protein [Yinghuangia seranimata]MDI2125805.1 hypothetical protein [Yinghuangia seranimata]